MEVEKKTIAITYDDATRMMDFCKDADKNVSRDFYDWYVGDGNYFSNSGVMVMDMKGEHIKDTKGVIKKSGRFTLFFNLNNPSNNLFELFEYGSPYAISRFSFNRQDNLTMEKIKINISYLSIVNYKKSGHILVSENIAKGVDGIEKKVKGITNRTVKDIMARSAYINKKKIVEEQMNSLLSDIITDNCRLFVYSVYAMMYYVSKQTPEEITSFFESKLNKDGIKVNSTYKYTGYIDLRNNKTYKPIIKKDPNEPTREYGRHIQKWTVRGHYRRTKNGMIWIEPHTKGEGELEKRIYGTEDEKDLNLIPKVFEVVRTKSEGIKDIGKQNQDTIITEHIIFPKTKTIISTKETQKSIRFLKNIRNTFWRITAACIRQ